MGVRYAVCDERYRAMVGKTFGRLTVIEYIGIDSRYPQAGRMIRCRCECGTVQTYNASRVYSGSIKHCSKCFWYITDKVTLCLRCRKATNRHLCQWADGKPRTDWVAEETYHKRDGYNSYRVIKCPDFDPDRRA